MTRLSRIVLVAAVLSGGWSGALAAALCPHEDCAAAAPRPLAAPPAGATEPACHAISEGAGGGGHSGHMAEAGAASLDAGAHGASHDAPAAGEHSGETGDDKAGAAATSLASADTSCAHCVGRPGAPRPATAERLADQPKRQDFAEVTPPVSAPAPPSRGFTREVVPSQCGPPGKVSQHLLNGVFRI